MDLTGNQRGCSTKEVQVEERAACNYRISERPIPSLITVTDEYEDLLRVKETCKSELEFTVKEKNILLKELGHINLLLKELEPLYDELEKTAELCSSQPENESYQLRKEIQDVEGQIKAFDEETRVAVDMVKRKADLDIIEMGEDHSQKLEELWNTAIVKKENLTIQINNQKEYLNKRLVEMTDEHERKKEDTIKKHSNHLKLRNMHLECHTKEIDIAREISSLEKKIQTLEKSLRKRASSSPKKRKLPLQGITSSGSKNTSVAQPPHPALSSVSPKRSDENQRKRKLFSVNSHFTDF